MSDNLSVSPSCLRLGLQPKDPIPRRETAESNVDVSRSCHEESGVCGDTALRCVFLIHSDRLGLPGGVEVEEL
jgi:hypothetical protein